MCSLAQPGLHTVPIFTLASGSISLAGESPEFSYQDYFKSLVLCVLAGALAQPGMAHLQSQLLLALSQPTSGRYIPHLVLVLMHASGF